MGSCYRVKLASTGRWTSHANWYAAEIDRGVLILRGKGTDGRLTGPLRAWAQGEWREVQWVSGP